MYTQAKELKKGQIVQAAAVVFAGKGYGRATISEIAEEAEVGKGTVFEYFESKEDLFFEVFRYQIEAHKQLADQAAEEAMERKCSAMELLTIVGDTILKEILKDIEMFSLSMEYWAATSSFASRDRFRDAMEHLYTEHKTKVAAILEAGKEMGEFKKDTDCAAIGAVVLGSLDGLCLQAWFDNGFDVQAAWQVFMETLARGMKK